MGLWIALGVVALIVLWFVFAFNGLVFWRNSCRNGWSQIDVQLKRRYDLIPNLVNTVKGYAKHEKEVFENVTKARSACMAAKGPAETAQAENFLSQTLKSLFAVVENYPELKANANFTQLQEELTATENKIAFARQFYNDTVMQYNTKLETIPTNIVAGMCNFRPEEFFKAGSDEERKNVKVEF